MNRRHFLSGLAALPVIGPIIVKVAAEPPVGKWANFICLAEPARAVATTVNHPSDTGLRFDKTGVWLQRPGEEWIKMYE